MKNENKKLLSIFIIILLNFILAIVSFFNRIRDKLNLLKCHGPICPDHILFGMLAPTGLYLTLAIGGYLGCCILKPEIRRDTLPNYLLSVKFNRVFVWITILFLLFGFELYYQFIASFNQESIKQFINSLVALILIFPYVWWFKSKRHNNKKDII